MMCATVGARAATPEKLPHRGIISALRDRGFALCKIDPETKQPGYRGWSARSLEPGDFAPGDMVGVVCGSLSSANKPGHALVVLDLDAPDAVAGADN